MDGKERISIRRFLHHSQVSVTRSGEHTIHWAVRVIGPTEASIRAAIRECRLRLDVLEKAVDLEVSQCERSER